MASIKLFGFTLGKKNVAEVQSPQQPSFTLPTETLDDGAVTISSNAYYGTYVDLDGSVRNESELITRYREMSNNPELEMAIDDIVNEAISRDKKGNTVNIILDNLKQPTTIKKKISEEFSNIMKMLNFSNLSDDIFKRWYIDGRIYYHIVIDESNPKEGIKELRYIDPRKIRKVREILKDKDVKTGAQIIKSITEYYVYVDRVSYNNTQGVTNSGSGLKIAKESVINVTSGLMDPKNSFAISYLHKAIKPLNQLRMIEDAIVIYRLSRAPERRIFYIDVGNLPKGKGEQYLRDIMVKYRNKMVYDASTGELRDDRKHMPMLEDFWLPRREGGKGTEITTLPAGQNLGELEDVKYFKQKLLQSLNVPISRLEPQQGGMIGLGRSAEVTRDEVKFNQFIEKLRNRFSQLFDDALRIQLVLKGICTSEEWEEFKDDIYFDFVKDNNFAELRESELLKERLSILGIVDPYVGKYYSVEWVKKNILNQTDDIIEEISKQIENEEQLGIGGSVSAEQPQLESTPPVDNTYEEGDEESLTPQLDAEVENAKSNKNFML